MFSVAHIGTHHLGPDWGCAVDGAEPPNQTFAGISLFMKVSV
jgi:hypothetical protein